MPATLLLFGGTIFSSAFLLFLVQPIMAKQILPWFGGSAGPGATVLASPWPRPASCLTQPIRDSSDPATRVARVGCVRGFAGSMEAAG
jgi:hypothetical protein